MRGLKNPVFWYSLSISLFRLTQLFTAPLLGHLADRWGRKKIFLVATGGTFISYLLMLPLNLPALLANRLMDGSTNGFYTAVRASVTDLSKPNQLVRNLGILGALGATGVILGPALGAFLIGHGPFRYSFSANQRILATALILAVVNILIAVFLIKETLHKNKSKSKTLDNPNQELTVNDLDAFELSQNEVGYSEKFSYANLVPKFLQIWKTNRTLGILIIMELLTVVIYGYYNYFLIFVDKRLNFSPQDVSWFMMYIGVAIALSQIVFFNFLANRLNPKTTLIFSGIIGSFVLLGYSMVSQTWMLYFFAIFDVISVSLIGGVVQGMIGKFSPENERGATVGLIQGFSGIVAFLSPLIYGYLGEVHINLPFFWFSICALLIGFLAMQIPTLNFDKKA